MSLHLSVYTHAHTVSLFCRSMCIYVKSVAQSIVSFTLENHYLGKKQPLTLSNEPRGKGEINLHKVLFQETDFELYACNVQ